MFKLTKKKISIISICLVFAILFGLMISSLGYFSDTIFASSDGTTGTVQVGFDDSGINLLNQYGQDILDPGDARPVKFAVTNEGNKSIDTEVVITLTSSEPMSNNHKASPMSLRNRSLSVYSSEYELYWAKDVTYTDGYGYTVNNGASPIQVRSMNAVGTQIVYVLDGTVLSGNSSLDEQEREYKGSVNLDSYLILPEQYMDIYPDEDISVFGIAEIANVGSPYVYDPIDTDKIVVIPDFVEYRSETIKGYSYLDLYGLIESGITKIAVNKEVHSFLDYSYDYETDEESFGVLTADEVTSKYGITIEYYDNFSKFEGGERIITEAEYNALSDEDKSNFTLCADNLEYDIVLLFDPNSSNAFQNSSVSLKIEVRAKQHRNTGAGWELVSDDLFSSIDQSVFTVEYDAMHRVTLTGIKDGADLTNVVIPEGVEVIPEDFFLGNTDIQTVTLPSTIKEIHEYAFYNCKNLTSVNFPEGLEYIGENAFSMCGLPEIVLPESLMYIESYTFYKNPATVIVIPDSINTIGYCAFLTYDEIATDVYTDLDYVIGDEDIWGDRINTYFSYNEYVG